MLPSIATLYIVVLKKKILDSNNGWIQFTNKPDQQLLNCEELKCLTNSRIWM